MRAKAVSLGAAAAIAAVVGLLLVVSLQRDQARASSVLQVAIWSTGCEECVRALRLLAQSNPGALSAVIAH